MKEKGWIVHLLPTVSSSMSNDGPRRCNLRSSGVFNVVSSSNSRSAAERGDLSERETEPAIGASFLWYVLTLSLRRKSATWGLGLKRSIMKLETTCLCFN